MQGLVLDEWRGQETAGLITCRFHRLPDGFSDTRICLPPPAGSAIFRAKMFSENAPTAPVSVCAIRGKAAFDSLAKTGARPPKHHPSHRSGPRARPPARRLAVRHMGAVAPLPFRLRLSHENRAFSYRKRNRRPPADADRSARDGNPKGRNREAGSVHDSPAAKLASPGATFIGSRYCRAEVP